MKKTIWLSVILLCIITNPFLACKKKKAPTVNRVIDIEEVAQIKVTEGGDFWSMLVTSNKKIIYSINNSTYISDAAGKNIQTLDNTYCFNLIEMNSGEVLGTSFKTMYVYNTADNSKKNISFNKGQLDSKTQICKTKKGDLYILASGKLLKSTDNATTWTDITNAMVFDSLSKIIGVDDDLYTNSNGIIYKSTDGGNVFNNLTSYPNGEKFGRLSVSPTHDLYLSLNSGGNYKSDNGGNTFKSLAIVQQIKGVNLSFTFCTDGSVITCSRGGTGMRNKNIARARPGSLIFNLMGGIQCNAISQMENMIAMGGDDGLYISDNSGDTWYTIGPETLTEFSLLYESNTISSMGAIGIKSGVGSYSYSRIVHRFVDGKWYCELLGVNFDYFKNNDFIFNMPEATVGYYSDDNGITFNKTDNPLENLLEMTYANDFKVRAITTLKSGNTIAMLGYHSNPDLGGTYYTNKLIKYNYTNHKWELYGNQSAIEIYGFVENSVGEIYAINHDKQVKSIDGGETWTAVTMQYFPMCFNSRNNYVSYNFNSTSLWFSNLTGSKVFEYTFNNTVETAPFGVFDATNIFYFTTFNNGKIFRSRAQLVDPI